MAILVTVTVGLLSLIAYTFYARYAPIKGVPCIDTKSKTCKNDILKLDIRDYNIASKDPVVDAKVLPVAYLKRHHNELECCRIHVIASDHMEKNIGIRFLKHKGFEVVGYTITTCNCKDKQKKVA
ncbi:hypothetical protein [Saliterribacillus persicus]|uniref:Rhodanese domain-containing protein n=1 Tax=Saliterribacillus persicus TaxID=930114 RepID=A0A368YG22_9BACI|nr:hypothetical protein [Saliterribacillus persicus]RCW77134.1 hypothetical protein DFR57_1011 [Saliterribacillus persicus]